MKAINAQVLILQSIHKKGALRLFYGLIESVDLLPLQSISRFCFKCKALKAN
jgi:hypothetical protein